MVINKIVKGVTSLGGLVFFVFIIPFIFILGKREYSFQLFLGIVSGYLLVFIIRLLYYKERPKPQKYNTLIERLDASSFPSLHSLNATVFTMISLINLNSASAYIVFSLYFPLILFSRYYLKKHDFVDIIAGVLMGLLISIIILKSNLAIILI